MVPSPSIDPDKTLGRPKAFLLKKGTPRKYDTFEFHVSSKAGFLWEYINPNTDEFLPLLKRPTFPNFKKFDLTASNELDLKSEADAKFQKAVKIHERKETLFLAQEKALAEISTFLNQSVHPDHYWVYWKKATLRERLKALKDKFKPSNNARIYEVDARYKEALKTNRITMDAWLSKYWRAYTEAEEFQIPAVTGFHGHLDFLKAINTFSPDFSVTQTAVVKEAMFDGKNATKLPSVQKLVERFRSHMRLRKAQGVTAEQLSREAFGVTLNGETPNQTGPFQNNSNNNIQNGNHHPNRKCIYGMIHTFKECPYICPKIRPSGWTKDPKVQKRVDKCITKGTKGFQYAIKKARKESEPQIPQSASALFVKGLPLPTDPQANSVTTGYSLKRFTLLDTCSNFHVGNRKAEFIDLHLPTVTAENDADDVVTSAAFAVAEKPEKPEAAVPEDESDFEEKVILESEDEDVVTEPLIEEFLPAKLTNQKKLHGNNSRSPLKPLEGDATLWHRRLAHLGPRALEKVVQAITGAKIQLPSKIDCQDSAPLTGERKR
ncbi:hypothetical protein DL768_010868 [Monosporascus sp. mg162]|nr:hypothetical protein DL768_010868 [Monosporascus sp. mg162]